MIPSESEVGLDAVLDRHIRGLFPNEASLHGAPELHSLNNDVRIVEEHGHGRRFIARVPQTRTAAALGIQRAEEREAVSIAAGIGLATMLWESKFAREASIAFLQAVGRSGDSDDLRALSQGVWMFHLFEMLWALNMDAHGISRAHSGSPFDYAAHARDMRRVLDEL